MTKRFYSRADFDLTDPHRETVTSAICQAAESLRSARPDSELQACIFPGGHGSELVLPQLLKYFSRITLVGQESSLIESVVTAQGLGNSDRMVPIEDFDLTGIQTELDSLVERQDLHRQDLSRLLKLVQSADWAGLPRQMDLNASICLLSQLIMKLVECVGEQHDQFIPLVQAVRLRHLQLMLDQLRPGGIGMLFFDFVSSDSLTALPQLEGEELERTLRAAIDQNNFFHGLNPQVILQLFEKTLGSQISAMQFSKPWVWKTPERAYAVNAVMFQKRV